MKMKIKNRSQRYDINRSRSRHEHKYSKYKKCLSMMMLICVKQHLSNAEAELKKSVAYIKKRVMKINCFTQMRRNIVCFVNFELIWHISNFIIKNTKLICDTFRMYYAVFLDTLYVFSYKHTF